MARPSIRRRPTRTARPGQFYHPRVEWLEDRCVPRASGAFAVAGPLPRFDSAPSRMTAAVAFIGPQLPDRLAAFAARPSGGQRVGVGAGPPAKQDTASGNAKPADQHTPHSTANNEGLKALLSFIALPGRQVPPGPPAAASEPRGASPVVNLAGLPGAAGAPAGRDGPRGDLVGTAGAGEDIREWLLSLMPSVTGPALAWRGPAEARPPRPSEMSPALGSSNADRPAVHLPPTALELKQLTPSHGARAGERPAVEVLDALFAGWPQILTGDGTRSEPPPTGGLVWPRWLDDFEPGPDEPEASFR
jgi:hypothetical protein